MQMSVDDVMLMVQHMPHGFEGKHDIQVDLVA